MHPEEPGYTPIIWSAVRSGSRAWRAGQGVEAPGTAREEVETVFGLSGMIIIVLALGTALALLLVAAFGSLAGVTRLVTRSFWCPFLDREVTAEFQEDAWDGKPVEVNRCTAFTPPTAITCEKLCLHLEKFPSAGKRTRAA